MKIPQAELIEVKQKPSIPDGELTENAFGEKPEFEDKGVIKGYIPDVNREYFGIELTALIALRLKQGNLLEIQKQIAKDDRLAAVYDITGEWDSLIIGYFKDRSDLNDFIKSLLSRNSIDRSTTHIVLNIVKEEKRVII